MPGTAPEDLLRQLAPQVLGALVRRYGHFDTAEDAVQEALLAAAVQWPADGIPGNPRGWLITVAARRLTDLLRAEQARLRREEAAARQIPPGQWRAPATDTRAAGGDDTLILLFMCCHPALSPASQIALTLRAVGGLGTAEIARAFLVPEATMTRRITRAKQAVKDSGIPFALPAPGPRAAARRRPARALPDLHRGVRRHLGSGLFRPDLSGEAIRLARMVHWLQPEDTEVAGFLALMLLTDARRPARTGPRRGVDPHSGAKPEPLGRGADRGGSGAALRGLGPRVTRAVPVAGGHCCGPRRSGQHRSHRLAADPRPLRTAAADTDNPMVALNHAIAAAMVRGPHRLDLLSGLAADQRITAGQPVPRRPGPPAGDGRRPRRRPGRLPGGRPAHGQPAAPALPARAGLPPRR